MCVERRPSVAVSMLSLCWTLDTYDQATHLPAFLQSSLVRVADSRLYTFDQTSSDIEYQSVNGKTIRSGSLAQR